MSTTEQVTVLVHGTYANPAYDRPDEPLDDPAWWRFGATEEMPSAADHLQTALEAADPSLAGTVWQPGADPRDGSLDYRDFLEWSGANRHTVRVQAARCLSEQLGTVASGRGCTPDEPLEVNYVGHSHGGNIILESLRDVPENVRPRQVCLLGTPLTWRHTELRFVYLLILIAFVLPYLATFAWLLLFPDAELQSSGASNAFWVVGSILLLSAMLWIGFGVARLIRAVTIRRFAGSPVYGPEADELLATLGGRSAVLFISDEDEADLMMHLGAAPLDAYQALFGPVRPVRTWLRGTKQVLLLPLRVFELVVVRPVAYVVLVPLLEVLLERFGLGFPTRSLLMRNYEMVTWTGRDPYGPAIEKALVEADDLQVPPRPRPKVPDSAAAPVDRPRTRSEREQELERITTLRRTLGEMVAGLIEQVHLSHSGYYRSTTILDQVASVIAASDEDLPAVIAELKR